MTWLLFFYFGFYVDGESIRVSWHSLIPSFASRNYQRNAVTSILKPMLSSKGSSKIEVKPELSDVIRDLMLSRKKEIEEEMTCEGWQTFSS